MKFVDRSYYLFKADFIYQLGDLDYPYIADMIELTMPNSDVRVEVEQICMLVSTLYKYCFVSVKTGIKNKQVFISQCYTNYSTLLFLNHKIEIVLV